jgi:hypothetical protein
MNEQGNLKALCPTCKQELGVNLDERKIRCKKHGQVNSFVFRLAPNGFAFDANRLFDRAEFDSLSLSSLAVAWCVFMSALKHRLEPNMRQEHLIRGYLSELTLFLWLWGYDSLLDQSYNSRFGSKMFDIPDFTFAKAGKKLSVEIKTTSNDVVNYKKRLLDVKIPDYVIAVTVDIVWPIWITHHGAMTKKELSNYKNTHEPHAGTPPYYAIPLDNFRFTALLDLLASTDKIKTSRTR